MMLKLMMHSVKVMMIKLMMLKLVMPKKLMMIDLGLVGAPSGTAKIFFSSFGPPHCLFYIMCFLQCETDDDKTHNLKHTM